LALPVVPVNGFAIYNTGDREDFGNVPTFHHDGVALKLEAGPVPIGPGKVSTQALYSTGGNSPGGGFRTVAQSARDNFGADGYWSYLMLVSPQGYTDVNDLGLSLAKPRLRPVRRPDQIRLSNLPAALRHHCRRLAAIRYAESSQRVHEHGDRVG
jgi:hypothetical protein